MSQNNINTILDKYWAGESSLEEEQILRQYFSQANVKAEHEAFQPLFSAMHSASDYSTRSPLSQASLLEMAQTIPSGQETKVVSMSWMKYVRVAAAAAFLMIAGWMVMDQMTDPVSDLQASTMETPEEALEQSRAALLYVSSVLNKGVKASEELNHLKSINNVIPTTL